jgi:nucleoid-associated protein YgaU
MEEKMDRKSHKELLTIVTVFIFLMSGCGMFKSSQTTDPGKTPATAQETTMEKKADVKSAAVSGAQDKETQGQAREAAQSAAEQSAMKAKTVSGENATGGTYIVKKGDSLWKIAKALYGKPLKWKIIYKANKKKIKDPNRIYPNQKFVIPVLK